MLHKKNERGKVTSCFTLISFSLFGKAQINPNFNLRGLAAAFTPSAAVQESSTRGLSWRTVTIFPLRFFTLVCDEILLMPMNASPVTLAAAFDDLRLLKKEEK